MNAHILAEASAAVDTRWILSLYVAGQTPKSLLAFANLTRICEQYIKGEYKIDLIDLLDNPRLAKMDQIFAIPTLVRRQPHPIRKVIGDLSNTDRVLAGLDLHLQAVGGVTSPPN
ncbi:MAG: hypothetical protein JWP34_2489 [Massilia sp.]|jgi:circadian clock protein KaiB|nr:hypothetical protein [Massilia sp.]